MFFSASVLLATALFATAAPTPSTVSSCITDVKIIKCLDPSCDLPNYHRIDTTLTQRANSTSWSYVFYKTEDNVSLTSCITDLDVIAEGAAGPTGSEWQKTDGSAHQSLSTLGGPTIWVARSNEKQNLGQLVDWIVLKPGQAANATEDFQRTFVNLGLGDAAGTSAAATWGLNRYISSGWVWLMYSHAGDRLPITDATVVACNATSFPNDCGMDLIKKGWQRRDINLNGPTINGSHIFVFTTTAAQADGKCLTKLHAEYTNGTGVINVNLNQGTNGTSIYLAKTRSIYGECLTSVVVQSVGYYTALPKYQAVRTLDGNLADFNEGISKDTADKVYILTSARKSLVYDEPKASLKFREDGSFRVAHFSDYHTMQQEFVCENAPDFITGNCTEKFSSQFMGRALDLLDPDFVVVNGDLYSADSRKVDGKSYPLQVMASVMKVLHPIVDRGLPFTVTFGNHDAEGDSTREEMMRIYANVPGFLGSRGRPELEGFGNYQLPIAHSSANKTDAMRMWFFDSHSMIPRAIDGSTKFDFTGLNDSTVDNGVNYGKVGAKQIAWYKQESAKLNAVSKANALAFYHIPLPEMSFGLTGSSAPERAVNLTGVHWEPLCSQGHGCELVTNMTKNHVGLFEAFQEAGDVKATYSGHDHEIDISVKILFENSKTDGIWMTCDGSSGYGGYTIEDHDFNREMRFTTITDFGAHASTYKVIDDIHAGTVHRNGSEPIVTMW